MSAHKDRLKTRPTTPEYEAGYDNIKWNGSGLIVTIEGDKEIHSYPDGRVCFTMRVKK